MPGSRVPRLVAALVLLHALAPRTFAGDESASAGASRRALVECEQGRTARSREERKRHFERGQTLGERAVALAETSADAHFALFCNMGELMRLDGESITSVLGLRRLMSELDRALELNPQHADALASKGTLLVRLPRVLGGDSAKGEQMLRRVLVLDPNAVSTRLTLAKMVEARGNRDEAIAFATRALQIAREQGRADKVAEAQATLAELRAAK